MMIPGGGLEKTVQKQKRYSEKFKSRMIQRMTGRRRMSAGALSKEVGVPQPTLSLWLREAGSLSGVQDDEKNRTPPARRPEDWPPTGLHGYTGRAKRGGKLPGLRTRLHRRAHLT